MKKSCHINSRKFDGTVHRSWKADLIRETAEYWLFAGIFEEEVNHPKLGVIRPNTLSFEYYWKHQWFNVFRFHEPEGDLRNFYCNVNQPPEFSGDVLNFIDLDLDVLVWKDFSTEILDLDEFEQNSKIFRYPEELIVKCRQTLVELQQMIERRIFPFADTRFDKFSW